MSDDGDALLAAIRAHPAEDTPRLVYADYLDERATTPAQRARAEFIRVQCAKAAIERAGTADPKRYVFRVGSEDVRYHSPPDFERWKQLDWRALELFRAYAPTWFDALPANYRATYADGTIQSADGWRYEFARGFLAAVTCPPAAWLRDGDAIHAAHPVERVRLTARPVWTVTYQPVREATDARTGHHCYWLTAVLGWADRPPLKLARGVRGASELPLSAARLLLAERLESEIGSGAWMGAPAGWWPGIAFSLPD